MKKLLIATTLLLCCTPGSLLAQMPERNGPPSEHFAGGEQIDIEEILKELNAEDDSGSSTDSLIEERIYEILSQVSAQKYGEGTAEVLTSSEPVSLEAFGLPGSIGRPSGETDRPIDIQLGERTGDDETPIYIRYYVDPAASTEIIASLESPDDPLSKIFGAAYRLRQCTGGKVCVERCSDGKGGTYCCRYQCI